MVSKSLTVALTLGILLAFAPSALSQSEGSPDPYLTTPDSPFGEAHPWQDAPGDLGPLTCWPGSAGDMCGFTPVPVFTRFVLRLRLKYVIKQGRAGRPALSIIDNRCIHFCGAKEPMGH